MTINVFGDSITVGVSASTNYGKILGSCLQQTVNNYGISGSQIIDQINGIYNSPSIDSFMLTGFNDMRNYGSTYMSTYSDVLAAAVAWLASGSRMYAQNPAVTYSGSWAVVGTYGGAITNYSSLIGSTATVSLTGTVIYIGMCRISSDYPSFNGVVNVKVDGVDHGDYNCFGFKAPYSTQYYAPGLIRITGLSSGTHSVVVTHKSGNFIYLDYFASNAPGPTIVLSDCLKCTAVDYTLGSPNWDKGSDAVVASYTSAVDSIATMFNADGLNIKRSHMKYDPNTQVAGPGDVHPSTEGQASIAYCFLNTYAPGWVTS